MSETTSDLSNMTRKEVIRHAVDEFFQTLGILNDDTAIWLIRVPACRSDLARFIDEKIIEWQLI